MPNQHRKKNFFKGGKELTIPEQTDGFKLEVESPLGEEEIIVYASTAPLGKVAVEDNEQKFYQVVDGLEEVARQTRGIKITSNGNAKKEAEFYEARCRVFTREK